MVVLGQLLRYKLTAGYKAWNILFELKPDGSSGHGVILIKSREAFRPIGDALRALQVTEGTVGLDIIVVVIGVGHVIHPLLHIFRRPVSRGRLQGLFCPGGENIICTRGHLLTFKRAWDNSQKGPPARPPSEASSRPWGKTPSTPGHCGRESPCPAPAARGSGRWEGQSGCFFFWTYFSSFRLY